MNMNKSDVEKRMLWGMFEYKKEERTRNEIQLRTARR
jgi:hypothetical protein